MSDRWDKLGIPHKGWRYVDVVDTEKADQICQMCSREDIRYVHTITHKDYPTKLEVGCICAGKMTQDYELPKLRERALRNKTDRKTRWLKRKWRYSAKGNLFININDNNLCVYKTKNNRWGYRVADKFGTITYPTIREAQLALFDMWENMLKCT